MNEKLYLHLVKYQSMYTALLMTASVALLTLYADYRFDNIERKIDQKTHKVDNHKVDNNLENVLK